MQHCSLLPITKIIGYTGNDDIICNYDNTGNENAACNHGYSGNDNAACNHGDTSNNYLVCNHVNISYELNADCNKDNVSNKR